MRHKILAYEKISGKREAYISLNLDFDKQWVVTVLDVSSHDEIELLDRKYFTIEREAIEFYKDYKLGVKMEDLKLSLKNLESLKFGIQCSLAGLERVKTIQKDIDELQSNFRELGPSVGESITYLKAALNSISDAYEKIK